jgi:hypothetical protein
MMGPWGTASHPGRCASFTAPPRCGQQASKARKAFLRGHTLVPPPCDGVHPDYEGNLTNLRQFE